MKPFEFYSAGRIIFGSGRFDDIGTLTKQFGKRVLIVAAQNSLRRAGILDQLQQKLSQNGIEFEYVPSVIYEPRVEVVDQATKQAHAYGCEVIIGMGGGSAIDTGKAISGLITNGGSVLDYLEGVGKGAVITRPSVPYIAIPTTAGTGAEVTKNAVIASESMRFKKSIRSPLLIPNIALIDPRLSLSVPPKQTAYSGMDALTQCIESYVSRKAQPIPEAIALRGIRLAAESLALAYREGDNLKAREKMSLCALLSGLALANSGLGAAHGLGAALGALFGIPHGLACAVMLPLVMEANMRDALRKYADVGEALTGKRGSSDEITARMGVDYIFNLADQMSIPKKLNELGISEADIPLIAENSGGSSMSGNPRSFSKEELTEFLMSVF